MHLCVLIAAICRIAALFTRSNANLIAIESMKCQETVEFGAQSFALDDFQM